MKGPYISAVSRTDKGVLYTVTRYILGGQRAAGRFTLDPEAHGGVRKISGMWPASKEDIKRLIMEREEAVKIAGEADTLELVHTILRNQAPKEIGRVDFDGTYFTFGKLPSIRVVYDVKENQFGLVGWLLEPEKYPGARADELFRLVTPTPIPEVLIILRRTVEIMKERAEA